MSRASLLDRLWLPLLALLVLLAFGLLVLLMAEPMTAEAAEQPDTGAVVYYQLRSGDSIQVRYGPGERDTTIWTEVWYLGYPLLTVYPAFRITGTG